jgi:hypothetical protein
MTSADDRSEWSRESRLHFEAEAAVREQMRAAALRDVGSLRFVADDADCPDVLRLAALIEEVGEVARCVHDGEVSNLRGELIQVAGVALAWASIA